MKMPFSFWKTPVTPSDGIYVNMIAHWSMDELIGPRLDSIASYALLETGGVAVGYSAGKIDGAALIDGGDGTFLETDTSTYPSLALPSGDFTYSVWVKSSDMSFLRQVLSIGVQDLSIFTDNDIGDYSGGPNSLIVLIKEAAISAGGDYVIAVDEWYHIVVQRVGTDGKLWVNGALIITNDVSTGTESSPENFTVGRSYDVAEIWTGLIDQLAVWDRAITSDEIAALFNGGDGIPL
jgi:hypothetical protein